MNNLIDILFDFFKKKLKKIKKIQNTVFICFSHFDFAPKT